MEQENRSFIHDTINLDEIRMLLGDDGDVSAVPTEEFQDEVISEQDSINYDSASQEQDLSDDVDHEIEVPSFMMEEDTDAVENADDLADEAFAVAEEAEAEMPQVEETVEMLPEETTVNEAESEEEPKAEKKKTSAAFELYGMLHDVIYLLAAVTLIFVFIVRLVGVQGDSMLPTLHNRDYLLLESNFLYGGEDLKYGDVVVLNVPSYEMQGEGPIVKRVIATEGQEVNIDFETGAVYVNGVLLHETYINTPTNYNWDGEYGLEYPAIVPENCIFVLGDNRNNSMDSRYAPIGMVDERCVLGKVLLIVLPGQTVDNAGNVIDPRDWGRIGLVS